MTDHYRKLERMYHRLDMNQQLGTVLSVEEGTAEVSLEVQDLFKHAANALHGMYYFKLLDDAAFFAANSLVDDVFVLTSQFTIYFLRPVFSGTLNAIGQVSHHSKSQLIAEAEVFDEQGNKVGKGSGIFVRSSIELTADIGYQ